jgi:hypothetical protein
MTDKNLKVSKSPLVTSIIFSAINVVAAIFYTIFAIEALPIALNPDRGLEGLGLAFLLIFLVILAVIIIFCGLFATFKAAKYNDSLKDKNKAAISLIVFNFILVFGSFLFLILLIMMMSNNNAN